MASGYCARCRQLVPIRAGAQHAPWLKSRAWFPLPHLDADGRPCPGEDREAGHGVNFKPTPEELAHAAAMEIGAAQGTPDEPEDPNA